MSTVVFGEEIQEVAGRDVLAYTQITPRNRQGALVDANDGTPVSFDPTGRWFLTWDDAATEVAKYKEGNDTEDLSLEYLLVPRGFKLDGACEVAPGVFHVYVWDDKLNRVGYVKLTGNDGNIQVHVSEQENRPYRRVPVAASGGLREGLLLLYALAKPELFDANIVLAGG